MSARTQIFFIEADARAQREAEFQAMLRRPDALPLPARPARRSLGWHAASLGRAVAASVAGRVRGIVARRPVEPECGRIEAPHP